MRTLEEDEYPNQYRRRLATEVASLELPIGGIESSPSADATMSNEMLAGIRSVPAVNEPVAKERHVVFQENQRGVSFDELFGPYLAGAKRIIITDPYLRMFHQLRNLMELMETISKQLGSEDEVAVHVVTVEDELNGERQTESLRKIADACAGVGIQFTWVYDISKTKHDRDITSDLGWKIVLSRGLDVFQRFELNDAFSFANRLQQQRRCKEFNVTYVRI